MIRLKELSALSERALHSLRLLLDRKEAKATAGDVVPDDLVSAEFDRYLPGQRYGAHKELIIKREVRREHTPEWFDPRTKPGQFGIITKDGLRIYLEVDVDVDRRNEPSTFERHILAFAEDDPEQIALI